jgi:very-short-patch-repair endonuclease
VIVEVEGAHHDEPINAVEDALRQNCLTASASSVLRIPILGLRTDPAAFMGQVREILVLRGWDSALTAIQG